jgi:hypothetical protein
MVPTDVETRTSLVNAENGQGVALVESGNPAQAIGRFRQAAALDPKQVGVPEPRLGAARQRRSGGGEREARQAIAIAPTPSRAICSVGRLRLRGKRTRPSRNFTARSSCHRTTPGSRTTCVGSSAFTEDEILTA